MPCSGRRGNRASEVEVGLLGLPRQNIEPSSLQEKLHVDLTGQGSRGKRHRGKAESPETRIQACREVFGLVPTECLSADKDPSSPHRDSGVRFQPVPEGRITAPVMGSFTAGAAPGFPRGRGIGWERAKTPAYNYQVSSRRDALRSSPSSDTL